jgi:hypothetical protein
VETDEWDLLRATPDYDADEMRSVGLWLPPEPSAVAESYVDDTWTTSPATPSAPGMDEPWPGTAAVAEPWPETASVASLLSDLFEVVPTSPAESGGVGSQCGGGESLFAGLGPLGDEAAQWPAGGSDAVDFWQDDITGSSGDAPGAGDPEIGVAVPLPAVAEGDLLGVALQAGARAGLIDAGMALRAAHSSRLTAHSRNPTAVSPEPRAVSRSEATKDTPQPGDLLDTALAAGERAGLMDGWGGGVQ